MRDAEVGELGAAGGRDHHVRRFDVAMHDRVAARMVEAFGDLRNQLGHLVEGQALAGFHHLLQRASLEELHRDVGDAVLLADVVDRDDVRMVQPAGGFRLAQKTFADFLERLGRQRRVERLDRDFALDQRIDGAIHHAHRAAPQLSSDPIASECFFCHASRGGENRPGFNAFR